MHNLMNIVVLGCSGAIGSAVTQALASQFPEATIHGFCRSTAMAPLGNRALPNVSYHTIDYTNELSISAAAATAAESGLLDLVFVANGLLHDVSNGNDLLPEKSLRDLSMDKFQQLFAANTITPALLAKHFLPQLSHQKPAFFAALSARVGSISDNRLGGWYAYRASKAALNMVIKNAAIEVGRRNKQAIVVGLHPGTVNSELSRPFQGNVPKDKLFTPDYAAQQLLQVLYGLTPADSGHCFAWDGQLIAP